MKKFYTIPALLAAATLSTAAFAEGEAKSFSEADSNQDGKLSIEEAHTALPDTVVIIDTDNDGMLGREEAQNSMPEVSFNDSQASGDMSVGESEYEQILLVVESQGMPDQTQQGQQGQQHEQSQQNPQSDGLNDPDLLGDPEDDGLD